MKFDDYKDVYKDADVRKKLDLLIAAEENKGENRAAAAEARSIGSREDNEYYTSEYHAMEQRIQWLYDEILTTIEKMVEDKTGNEKETIWTEKAIKLACHMLGLDNRRLPVHENDQIQTYLYYRNYFNGQNATLDVLSEHGLAYKNGKDSDCIYYYLTQRGINELAKCLNCRLFDEDDKEEGREMSDEDREEIERFWKYVKEHDIYTYQSFNGWRVNILLEPDQIEDFSHAFTDPEESVPTSFGSGYVAIDLKDLLHIDSKIAASQIWELRPNGVREEL